MLLSCRPSKLAIDFSDVFIFCDKFSVNSFIILDKSIFVLSIFIVISLVRLFTRESISYLFASNSKASSARFFNQSSFMFSNKKFNSSSGNCFKYYTESSELDTV